MEMKVRCFKDDNDWLRLMLRRRKTLGEEKKMQKADKGDRSTKEKQSKTWGNFKKKFCQKMNQK